MEIGPERSRGLYQLGVMHPDLARPAGRVTGLDQKAITLLLLLGHLVIRDLGVAAEGRRLGHIGFPSHEGSETYPATAHLPCRPAAGISRGPLAMSRVKALLRPSKARRWPSRTGKSGRYRQK